MPSSSPNDPTALHFSSDSNETEYFETSSDVGNDSVSAFSSGFVLAGKFRLEKQLGRGGMGEAWKAFDTLAERPVVLKFVPKEIQHVQEAMDSVMDSFKKVHTLQHQHICPVYDLFQDDDHGLCLVMKFIDGMPLDEYRRKLVEKNKSLSFSNLVQILWGVAQGLDYAHAKKVIHRDIKPQNIMVGKADGVQIIDFGLAEEIRTSMVRFSEVTMNIAGTRPYMAPEQWQGKYQDAATDQYALAVTAYELFSGRVPFQGSDVGVLRECVLHDQPDLIASLPDYINAALLKALSKQREDRFENCKAFVRALTAKPKKQVVPPKLDDATSEQQEAAISMPSINLRSEKPGETVWKPQVSTVSRNKPEKRRNVVPIFMTIGFVFVFLIFGLFFALSGRETSKPIATNNPTSTHKKAASEKKRGKPVPAKFPQDLSVLSDTEKRELQQQFPEFDWSGTSVIMLPELSENALRKAFEKASNTSENDIIVARTTKEKRKIVLQDGQIRLEFKAKEKGSVALIGLGTEKLIVDGGRNDRIFDIVKETEIGFGNIHFTNGYLKDARGAAVSLFDGAASTIVHCDFIDNSCIPVKKGNWWAGFGGGAVFCGKNSTIVLRDVRFEKNRNNHLEAFTQPQPEGLAVGVDSSGALFVNEHSSIIAKNVVFRNNIGGAAFIHDAQAAELQNISLIDNQSLGSGAIHLHGNNENQTYRVTNFFAFRNQSDKFGGGLQIGGKGRYILDHLTLLDNYGEIGGGLCIGGGGDYEIHAREVVLSNSIIASNRGKFVWNFAVSHVNIEKLEIFNCITNESDSNGRRLFSKGNNIILNTEELKFGELRDFGNGLPVMPLLKNNPVIDAGIITENTPKTDITGRPRNVGKAPDMGAFEWQ